jgi:hypothetical protein
MTTPAGFIDLERLNELTSGEDLEHIKCVRVEDIREIAPVHGMVLDDRCEIKVVYGVNSEKWQVRGTYSAVKSRVAQAQEFKMLAATGCQLTEQETQAIRLLAELHETTPGQVLKAALEHYARTSLAQSDFLRFYLL